MSQVHCRRGWSLVTALPLLVGCTQLADIRPDGRCGNRILEPSSGETCDSVAPEGLRCGAPGSAVACQLVCGPAFDGTPCPDGWTCGTDGVCRVPAPSYSFLGEADLGIRNPYGVEVADFDGDGRLDLAFLFGPRVIVRYGDGTGRFTPRIDFNIDTPFGGLTVADLDTDGRADLVIPEFPGPLIVRGEADRTLSPVAVPVVDEPVQPGEDLFDRRLVVVPSLAPFNDVLVLRPNAGGLTAQFLQSKGEPIVLPTGVGVPGGRLAYRVGATGAPAPGVLVRTVAVAYEGGRQMAVFDAGCPSESCSIDGLRIVALDPALVASEDGTLVGDVNGDGLSDVVVSAREGGPEGPLAVGVAFGRSGGGYCPDPGGACVVDAAGQLRFDVEGAPQGFEELGRLLALFDFDQDGRSDFVFAHGLIRNVGFNAGNRVRATPVTTPRFASLWNEVAVGDFNRDGLFDIAATYPAEVGIEYLIAVSVADKLFFNRARVDTGVPMPLDYGGGLHVGDFDGDLFADVAFADEEERVWVAFGDPQGAPTEVVSMGSFGFLYNIVAGHFDLQIGFGTPDVMSDLMVLSSTVVVAQAPNEHRKRVTLLTGTSERRLLAPVLFVSQTAGNPDSTFGLPIFTRAGRFSSAGSKALDLLAVTREEGPRGEEALWLAQGAPGAQFALGGFVSAPLGSSSCGMCAARGLGALDMAGEIVEQPGGPRRLVIVEKFSECRNRREPSRPLVVDLSLNDAGMDATCQRLAAYAGDAEFGPPRRLRIFDADADGQDDILVQRVPEEVELDSVIRGLEGGLQFYRGPWSATHAPRMVQAPPELGSVFGFERLPGDRARDPASLVLVGSKGIAVGRLDSAGVFALDRYVARFGDGYVLEGTDAQATRQSLRVFDVNGDRLEDIVWIHTGYVTVYVRDECTASLAEEGRCSRPAVRTPGSQR